MDTYAQKRRGKVNLAAELERRGWKIWGFKPDGSDCSTDYYDPAAWDGIATKGEHVVCVDVSTWLLKRSGGWTDEREVSAGDCPACGGTGQEPDGWTWARAQADPVGFNTARARRDGGGVPLFPNVVSPIHFKGELETCIKCRGAGKAFRAEKVTIPFPTFQAHPKNALWHVETDGVIIASGIGLTPCGKGTSQEQQTATRALCDRIEAACKPTTTPKAKVIGGVTVSENEQRDGVEVKFPTKPSADVLATLRAAGFRWHGQLQLWYARRTPERLRLAHSLASV